MITTHEVFNDRKNEIEFYYSVMIDIDDETKHALNTIDNQRFFRIMKSNFLLMLYNLVEATFTTGMLEIYKPESGLTTYTNRVRNIVLDITQNAPLALTKGMLGINGNLNAKQIKDICDRHRIRYRVTDDRQVLEKVKKKRNSLAHGDESFSHCARDLTLTDLETIKDTVIQFIQEILTGMEKYCDEKQFLRHA